MNRILIAAGALLAAGTLGMPPARSADAPEPLALRRIMEDLGRRMQGVAAAIAREDWPLVERTAPRIAEHEQPPALEKGRILAFVGSNAGRFRAHDDNVRRAALELGRAAQAKDGHASIAAFAELQRSCHGCHAEFRGPFLEHFYGRR